MPAGAERVESSTINEPVSGASSGAGVSPGAIDAPVGRAVRKAKPKVNRVEAFFSRLSAKSNFFHRLFSLFYLPYAFRSGIRMKRVGEKKFAAVLPFKRFNRNWYNAMAGGALLANSEIAAGMYLFGKCGGGYSVVCKELTYKFLRPCFGPAEYQVEPLQEIEEFLATGDEFNIDLSVLVMQQIKGRKRKERRVGKCSATFYVTPHSLSARGKSKTKPNR